MGWREGVYALGQSLRPEAPTGVKSREKLALNYAEEAVWSQHKRKTASRAPWASEEFTPEELDTTQQLWLGPWGSGVPALA